MYANLLKRSSPDTQNSDAKRIKPDESDIRSVNYSPATPKASTAQPVVARKHWYQNVPKDEDIDDTLFGDAFDKILQAVSDELRVLNISYIINRYRDVLSEFYELSAIYRARAKKYNKLFERFINTICTLYNIVRVPMMVQANKYSPKDWGHVYWEFMHLSSILLSHAFENSMISTLLSFPTLIYNIDAILPCPKCAYHYSLIKQSEDVKQVIKSMTFGSVMISLQIFHNLITANVDKTPDYANIPNRDRFLISDFAATYKCIDVQSENAKKSTNYSKSSIDWQPSTHVYLCILLSTYCDQPSYDRASNLLKYKLYATNRHFDGLNLRVRNADIRPIDTSDIMYASMSAKQIQYCLMRALLLQFQDTAANMESIETNKRLNKAIVSMYREYNEEVKALVSNNMVDSERRTTLLQKLGRIQSIPFE
nr:TPA: Ac92-like protein [Oryctes rhinoceros nudivirus]